MAGPTPSDGEESEQAIQIDLPLEDPAAAVLPSAAAINFDVQPVVLVARLGPEELHRFLGKAGSSVKEDLTRGRRGAGDRRRRDRRQRTQSEEGRGRSGHRRRRNRNKRTRASTSATLTSRSGIRTRTRRSPSEGRRRLTPRAEGRRRDLRKNGGEPVVIKFVKENSNSSDGFSEWSVRESDTLSSSSSTHSAHKSRSSTKTAAHGARGSSTAAPSSVRGQSSDSRHTSLETDTEPYVSDEEGPEEVDGRSGGHSSGKKRVQEEDSSAAEVPGEANRKKAAEEDAQKDKSVPPLKIETVLGRGVTLAGKLGSDKKVDLPSKVVADTAGEGEDAKKAPPPPVSVKDEPDAKRLKLSGKETKPSEVEVDPQEKLGTAEVEAEDGRKVEQLSKKMAVETIDEQVSPIKDEVNEAKAVDGEDLDQIVTDPEDNVLVMDEGESVIPESDEETMVCCGKRAELELDLYASLATMELMSSPEEDEGQVVEEYKEERRIERLAKILANEVSEEARKLTASCLSDKSDIVARLFRLLREVSQAMHPSNGEVLQKIIKLENVLRELVANYRIEEESVDVSEMESLTGQRKTAEDLAKLEHSPTLQEYLGLRVEPPMPPGALGPMASPAAPFKDLQSMVQLGGTPAIAAMQIAQAQATPAAVPVHTNSLLSGGHHQLIVAGAGTGVVVPSVDHELLRKSLAQTLGAQLSQRPAFRVPPPTEQQLLQAAQMRNFVPRPRPINSTKYQPYPSANPQQLARLGTQHAAQQQLQQQVAQQQHQLQLQQRQQEQQQQQQRIAMQQQQQQFQAQQLARQNQLRLQQQHLQQQPHLTQQQQQRLAQFQAQQQVQQRQFVLAQQQQLHQQQQRVASVSSVESQQVMQHLASMATAKARSAASSPSSTATKASHAPARTAGRSQVSATNSDRGAGGVSGRADAVGADRGALTLGDLKKLTNNSQPNHNNNNSTQQQLQPNASQETPKSSLLFPSLQITPVSSPVTAKAHPPASSPKPAATAISLPAGLSITPLAPPKKTEIQLPKDIEMIPIQQKEPAALPKLPPGITLTSVPGSSASSSSATPSGPQQKTSSTAGAQQSNQQMRQQHQGVAVHQVAVQQLQQRQQMAGGAAGGAAVIHRMMMQQVPTGRAVAGQPQTVDQRQVALQQQQQQQMLRHQQLQQQQHLQQRQQQIAIQQQQQQAQQQQWRLQQQAQQQRLQQIMQRQQQQQQQHLQQSTTSNSQQQQHFYRINNAGQQPQQQQQASANVQQRWQQAQQRQFYQ